MNDDVTRAPTTERGAAGRPVLVLGADSLTGLGVARDLRHEVDHIVGLAVDTDAPACWSSAWHEVRAVSAPTAEGWVAAIQEAGRAHGRMVLIPASDDTVAIVGDHAGVLGDRFDVVVPRADVVTTLLDKTAFHRWAAEQGLPVPHTEVVDDEPSLAEALVRVPYPAVLKPHERTAAWQAVNHRRKAFRLERASDIDGIPFPLFDVAPRYVLQQWIPGLDSDVHFCLVYRDRDGHELGHQTGRKVLQWPVDTGNTVICVTDVHDELHALTRKVFDAAGAVGLGSLEVKRSRADGRLYITEPTVGRPNLQSGVAAAAGSNLSAIAYRDACGLPPSTPGSARRATWVHESTLPLALAFALRHRRLDVRAVLGALRGRAVRRTAFTAAGDTVPLRRELRRQMRRAARSVRRRFLRR